MVQNGNCGCNDPCADNQIYVCNTLFTYSLQEVDGDATTNMLIVSSCNTPTAVYDIATIKTKTNSCIGLTYYQAAVNSDPVEIIQDCSLCCIIARAIEIYFNNLEPITCNNCCKNNCNNNFFGFF